MYAFPGAKSFCGTPGRRPLRSYPTFPLLRRAGSGQGKRRQEGMPPYAPEDHRPLRRAVLAFARITFVPPPHEFGGRHKRDFPVERTQTARVTLPLRRQRVHT